MIVKLTNLGSDLADLPSLQAIASVEQLSAIGWVRDGDTHAARVPVQLLKLPQSRVHLECATEVALPLFRAMQRQISVRDLLTGARTRVCT